MPLLSFDNLPPSTGGILREVLPQGCLPRCQVLLSTVVISTKGTLRRLMTNDNHPIPPFVHTKACEWTKQASGDTIPDICHGRHRQRPCKFFLAGVNFYRFNAKNWHFLQILREKVAFFTDLTQKIGVFRCKFYSPKILPV